MAVEHYIQKTDSRIEDRLMLLRDHLVQSKHLMSEENGPKWCLDEYTKMYVDFLVILCFSRAGMFYKGEYDIEHQNDGKNDKDPKVKIYDCIWKALYSTNDYKMYLSCLDKFDYDFIQGKQIQIAVKGFKNFLGKTFSKSIISLESIIDEIQSRAAKEDYVTLFDILLKGDSRQEKIFLRDAFPHVTSSMIQLLDTIIGCPEENKDVYLPYSGLCEYPVQQNSKMNFYGDEPDSVKYAIGLMNLLIHDKNIDTIMNQSPDVSLGLGGNIIRNEDLKKYDVIVYTPQNAESLSEGIALDSINRLEELPDILKNDGVLVAIVPDSFKSQDGTLYDVRKKLIENHLVDTVISLLNSSFDSMKGRYSVLIINKKMSKDSVRFIDGEKIKTNNVITMNSLKNALSDTTKGLIVPYTSFASQDYSFNSLKYDDSVVSEFKLSDTPFHFKDIVRRIVGKQEEVSGKVRRVAYNNLSSDPADYVSRVDKIEEVLPISQTSIAEVQFSIEKFEKSLEDAENSSAEIVREINNNKKEIRRLQSEMQKLKDSYQTEELKELRNKKKEIESESINILGLPKTKNKEEREKELEIINRHIADLIRAHEVIDAPFFDTINKKIEDLRQQNENKTNQNEQLSNKIKDYKKEIVEANVKLTKLKSTELRRIEKPSLVLGGLKPAISFVYIEDASESNPYYLEDNFYAFEINDDDIPELDHRYLVYGLSTVSLQTNGSSSDPVSIEDLYNILIPRLEDMSKAKDFLDSKDKEYGRLTRAYKDDQEHLTRQKESLLKTIGEKKHSLKNIVFNIVPKLDDLKQDIIDMKESRLEIDFESLIIQVDDIARSFQEVSDAIADLSKIDVKMEKPVKTDIVSWLRNYIQVNQKIATNYSLELDADSCDQVYIYIADGPLKIAVDNIRFNAEKHGFSGLKRDDLYLRVKVFVSNNKCYIDFVNNGKPMIPGLTLDQYADTKQGYGETAGSGQGGGIIKETVINYHGELIVNPENRPKDTTVIRFVFPITL